jgi:hypothetical protein
MDKQHDEQQASKQEVMDWLTSLTSDEFKLVGALLGV